MISPSENVVAKSVIQYRGVKIKCSSVSSALCVNAVLRHNKKKVRRALTIKGANLNKLCLLKCQNASYTVTPLALAARFTKKSCHFIRWMLKHGADPNVKCDMTPLGVAVKMNYQKLAALLVDSGADVDLKSRDTDDESRNFMHTPLHVACSKRFFTTATYLLLKGAFPDDDDEIENKLADGAREYRKWKHIFSTTSKSQVHVLFDHVSPAFHPLSCTILDDSKNTTLHYACAAGDRDQVNRILDRGARINARNAEKKSPIEVALDFGHSDIVFMLIEHGCHLPQRVRSATNSRGNTLLHIACKQNRVAVAKKLIEAGSSLSVTNKNGKSAMHYAWRNGELRNTVLDRVFRCSSSDDDNTSNDNGAIMVNLAMTLRLVYRRFLIINDDVGDEETDSDEHDNADNDDDDDDDCVNDSNPEADELALYKTLCTVMSERPFRSFTGETVHKYLCFSCGRLTPDACFLLQSRGLSDVPMLFSSCSSCTIRNNHRYNNCRCYFCSIYTLDEVKSFLLFNRCPICGCRYMEKLLLLKLHIACSATAFSKTPSSFSIITELIWQGAGVNAKLDCRGNTALHLACRNEASPNIIDILLYMGADPHVVNDEGKTPVDYAVDKKFIEILKILIKHVHDNIICTRSGKTSTKLLMLANAGLYHDLHRLACDGAIINPPATSNCGSSVFRSCLLDILAKDGKWDLVRLLVRMGCCDFTDEMFRHMFQNSFADETEFYNKIKTWKWFSLAGFCQNRDFAAHFEIFMQKLTLQQFANDTHMDISAETAKELEWLQHDVENPPSLFRKCMYTIRRQLILAEPEGKSILPSVERLGLPKEIQFYLKLPKLEDHFRFPSIRIPFKYGIENFESNLIYDRYMLCETLSIPPRNSTSSRRPHDVRLWSRRRRGQTSRRRRNVNSKGHLEDVVMGRPKPTSVGRRRTSHTDVLI